MAKLTQTQDVILRAAAQSSTGSVGFYAGDRRGTRVARIDEIGRPWIVAYGSPEWFLQARGLLEKGNESFVYRITDAGRAAIAGAEREVQPSSTQLKILTNVAAGRAYDYGRPFTRSDAAGWGCSWTSCIRRGWLDQLGSLTDAGRAFLSAGGRTP